MNTGAFAQASEPPRREPPLSSWPRFLAVVEVTFVFALTHFTYRALKNFTPIGRWDQETNFTPGAVMILVTIASMLICRRNFGSYGLSLREWQKQVGLGLAASVLFIGISATAFLLTGFRLDATRPPDPHGAHQLFRMISAASIAVPGYIAVIAYFCAQAPFGARIPAAVSIPGVFSLLAVLPLVEARFHPPGKWFEALWLLFGAGFGEEIFFRGYIQSRIDCAFRCVGSVGKFKVGPGLFVSALFFGLIHALNTVDYFHGRFDFGWSFGLQSIAVGLFYGLIRSRTESVVPGAIIHGLQDAFVRIPQLLP